MKQVKWFFTGMVTMLLIVILTGTAVATTANVTKTLVYRDIKVSLDGNVLDLKDAAGNHVEPFMFDGTNYLPVRALSEALGLNVSWDAAANTIVLSSKKTYEVTRVVDGDTIVVNYNGVEETVRLIGVDTPESVHPDKSKNTEAGFAASEFTTVYLSGQQVELEFDVQQRDQYGRLLAYVYKDGEMFNKKLLMTGYAEIATYPPNVKYVDEFTQIVKNRDPSIPSGEYNDGYMKAPKVVYNTPPEKNGMSGTFLYVDGTVKLTGTASGSGYATITTEFGDFVLFNMLNKDDFSSIKKGDHLAIGFLYAGYSSELNAGLGAYMETLKVSTSPTTIPGPAPTQGTTNEQRTVYITPTGKRYHFDGNCNGGTYISSTLNEALRRGLTPCNKCAQ